MRKYILILFLLCASCTKPLGDQDPLDQPSSEAPGEFSIASIQRVELQLLVAWTSSKGAKSYELNYGTTAGTYTESITATKSPIVIQGLTPGTTYYFRMKAINTIGTTLSTAEKSYPFLGAPGDFSILTAVPGNAKVTLAWELSPEASSYAVMSGPSADNITTTVAAKALPPFVVGSLTNGTTYHFKVVATNPIGSKDSSNTMSATPTPPPSVPLNLSAIPASTKCTLSWDAPSAGAAPLTYTVRRWIDATNSVVLNCTNPLLPACEDTGRPPGIYEYTVDATNIAGTGPQTNRISCPVGMPGDFQLLTAVPADSKVTLTWQASANATAYTVMSGTSSNNITTTVTTNATSPYVVTGLNNTVPYYFKVVARNVAGTKDSSNTLSTTPNTPPSTPLSPMVAVTAVGKCTLSWMPSASGAPPITYTVHRVINTSTKEPICVNISERTCSEENLPSTTHKYTITANNSVGSSTPTSELSCTLALPTAVTLNPVPSASTRAVLTWSGGTRATSFIVKYGTTSPPNSTASENATSPYTIENLTNGTRYFYQVIAKNGYGDAFSGIQESIPASDPPEIKLLGLPSTMLVSVGAPIVRKFSIFDPDPEDSIDCGTSVTAISNNTSVVANNDIHLDGIAKTCSITMSTNPATTDIGSVKINATDGVSTGSLTLRVMNVPNARRIYSLKKHGNYSGPAVRIRNSLTSNETDIGFDENGSLNKATFDAAISGSAKAYLIKWYDQGLDSLDAVQADSSLAPILSFTGTPAMPEVTADGTDSLSIPNLPQTSELTIFMKFIRGGTPTNRTAFFYGSNEIDNLSGFSLINDGSNKWSLSTAVTANTRETTFGPTSSTTEAGVAVVIRTNGDPRRDLITSTISTPARVTGALTSYVAPAAGTPLYLFAEGNSSTANNIKGTVKEIFIFDSELSNGQVTGLTEQ